MPTPDFRELQRGNHRLACPECNRRTRDSALSVDVKDDGAIVWHCFRCQWSGAIRPDRPTLSIVKSAPPVKAQSAKRNDSRDHAREIWNATQALAGTIAADYLALRHCVVPPTNADLRFHPALYCIDVRAELPALVARVSTVVGNRGVGIHRIWIREGAAKAVAKKRLGGADEPVCVRLWPNESVEATLGIAEGIETALAAAHRLRPMWSTIDAGQMARFPLLTGIPSLTIFADYDAPGA